MAFMSMIAQGVSYCHSDLFRPCEEDTMIKLSLTDRLALTQILPKDGDIITVMLVKDLREKIAIKPDEIEKFNFRKEGNQLLYDDAADLPINHKEIEMTGKQKIVVEDVLKKLDGEKALTQHHISLYEKFIGLPNDPDLVVIGTKPKKSTGTKK